MVVTKMLIQRLQNASYCVCVFFYIQSIINRLIPANATFSCSFIHEAALFFTGFMFTFELWLHKCESENFLLLRQRNNSVSFTDVTPRPTAALGGTMLCDLKSTSPTLLLSHISNKTLSETFCPLPRATHEADWLVVHLFLWALPVFAELLWVLMETSVNP